MTWRRRRRRTVVYVLRGLTRRVLYVGITSRSPSKRWAEHAQDKPWWPLIAQAHFGASRSKVGLTGQMDNNLVLTDAATVEAALRCDDLVPPPPPASIGTGPMAALRSQMARFSPPEQHQPPRAAVDTLIASLVDFPFTADAERRTAELVSDGAADLEAEVGLVVPVETMASALKVSAAELAAVRADTAAVAAVIGRQEAITTEGDGAAERLMSRFGSDDDAIAAISLLYQTHDATAALFRVTLEARRFGQARRAAVTKTVRLATSDTTVAAADIAAGSTITLDLAQTGFEFGAGPHACPGRDIAEQIVTGMMNGLA